MPFVSRALVNHAKPAPVAKAPVAKAPVGREPAMMNMYQILNLIACREVIAANEKTHTVYLYAPPVGDNLGVLEIYQINSNGTYNNVYSACCKRENAHDLAVDWIHTEQFPPTPEENNSELDEARAEIRELKTLLEVQKRQLAL